MAEQRPPQSSERAALHPEHLSYIQQRLSLAQKRYDQLRTSARRIDLDENFEDKEFDRKLEESQAELARLQAVMDAALGDDTSIVATELQRQYEANGIYVEQQRQYIVRHPLGTLEGDDIYAKKKVDIRRGEQILERVRDDPDLSEYVQEKLTEDRSVQAFTKRGSIMRDVARVQGEQMQIEHLQQLLPEAQMK